jgi:transposase
MRGADGTNEALFSTVKLEEFVPQSHPLRPIRKWMNDALSKMGTKFSAMVEADVKEGRPSIAPEKLMRAMLLQVLYRVRSERQLVEQISYNLLFRWFVGLSIEDTVWNHSVFSKNRNRLIEFDAVTDLFNTTVEMAQRRGLLSGEHFSVDGTLIHAWAGQKSIRRKDRQQPTPLQTAQECALRPEPQARVGYRCSPQCRSHRGRRDTTA